MAKLSSEQLEQCWAILQEFAPKSLYWNHYDFSVHTDLTDTDLWKAFLLTPDVKEWLQEERNIMQETELAKLTDGVATSRSVGQAQILSAMDRLTTSNKASTPAGPAFIYSYVPLNSEQRNAPNVRILEEDIFHVDYTPELKFDSP